MNQPELKFIARWESLGGKYWVELFFRPEFHLADGRVVVDSYYRGNGCGGSIPATDEQSAIAIIQARVDSGYFQADANKTPMKRTI